MPLCIACEKRSSDIAHYLLTNGADPRINSIDSDGKEMTLLMVACRYKQKTIIKSLIGIGVDVNVQIGGYSALKVACTYNAYSCFEYLLSNGASPHENYEPGLKTILHIACEKGKLRFVRLLVEKCADVNAITTF